MSDSCGVVHREMRQVDPDTPPGWTVNPSARAARQPIIVLALIGLATATWLALYQHEIIDTVFEPFFGEGTEQIVRESGFAEFFERFPIRDAGLGALVYLADVITGSVGGTRRWETHPWLVLLFGVFVGPLGAMGIILPIFQPVLYDNFCTLCLISAMVALSMIGPAADEILATLQHLRREHERGRPVRYALFGLKP